MTLKKTLTVEQTGAPATIHHIDNVTVNYSGNTTTVSVSSYYDASALAAKRMPMGTASFNLDGIPPVDIELHAYVESELVKAAPAGETVDETLRQYSTHRYALQGAQVVKV
ncbi:hypothetical protein [Burkholderia sp. LMG 13014]|uniref:hypothetical protein n=1 Tax=Burkholderia sp. LMG 13014 TaxID=2709306 RepID=UPI001963BEE7|nr:hypothetical protein [Burkholderia sp. LMG 13014]